MVLLMRGSFLIFLFMFVVQGCKDVSKDIPVAEKQAVWGLAAPITLNPDETEIHLHDYFTDLSMIDSVSCNAPGIQIRTDSRNSRLNIHSKAECPHIFTIQIWEQHVAYSILFRKSMKVPLIFTFNPEKKTYQSVRLTGEMNGWNPEGESLLIKNDKWEIPLLLNPGSYQYRLIIDGEPMPDPHRPEHFVTNEGITNSILRVPDKSKRAPILHTRTYTSETITMRVENPVEKIIAMWDNYQLPQKATQLTKQSLFVEIPRAAKKHERSFIRVWAYNKFGVSNDILIPLEYGKVIGDVSQLKRQDKRAQVMYCLVVDRFNNGSLKNDRPLNTSEVHPKVDFMGGDLSGITRKIDMGYFRSLGINTICLSPIVQNPQKAYGQWNQPETKFTGYHGLWPTSLSRIDERFGTNDELRDLISAAHHQDMNVIMDYVSGYVHQQHPLVESHPEWLERKEYQAKGEEKFLYQLDFSQTEVRDALSDSALYWIRNFNIDGFRHISSPNVPGEFWRSLTLKAKQLNGDRNLKTFFQSGETYGNHEFIAKSMGPGKLDSFYDLKMYENALAVFAKHRESFKRLYDGLELIFNRYGYHNMMSYSSGGTGQPRFVSYASYDLSFNEDPKTAGWSRRIGVKHFDAYQKLVLLNAFNLTIPGIPVLYYGDEIGMSGAGSPDNHRMMRFKDWKIEEDEVFNQTNQLIKMRRNSLALTYGDFTELIAEANVFAFARSYFNEVAIVILNKDRKARTLSVRIPDHLLRKEYQANFGNKFQLYESRIKITIPQNGFEVITGD